MEKLASLFGATTLDLWFLLVYVALQLLIFVLYQLVFAKKKFVKIQYRGLLLLNIVFNIACAYTLVSIHLGWNWGAIVCASMVAVVVAMFECYAYYYLAVKNVRRDDA